MKFILLRVGNLTEAEYSMPYDSTYGVSPKAQVFFFALFLAVLIGFWLIVRNVKKKK